MEEERTDALEVAAQEDEEGKAKKAAAKIITIFKFKTFI